MQRRPQPRYVVHAPVHVLVCVLLGHQSSGPSVAATGVGRDYRTNDEMPDYVGAHSLMIARKNGE